MITNLQENVLPAAEAAAGPGVTLTLGGSAPEERDFVHAVYGNFGWVLLFVIVLTFILLARAFRSVVLPLKAVILNLISLGCAYGVVVFIFQMGHGSELIWNVQATGVVISWIPLMIFAFLYGISMDYEVFMITRIRESYDETGDTSEAISLGLARTGKLVTSGAGVLMFAFFALSTGPGARHQAVRDRIGRRRDHRRDADPACCSCPRRCSCSAAGTGGCRPGWRRCCARRRARSSRAPPPRRRRRTPDGDGLPPVSRVTPPTVVASYPGRGLGGDAAAPMIRRMSLHRPERRPRIAVRRRRSSAS